MFDVFLRLVTPLLRLLGLMPSKVKTEVLFVARAFSTLQHAGAPVLRSLRVVASDLPDGKVKGALNVVVKDIESGSPLSEALAQHPDVFNRAFVGMVRAGEAGGALEVVLARLVAFLEAPYRNELGFTLRSLGFMTSSGVPILEAVCIVKESCLTERCEDLWLAVYQSIREGDTIAEPFKKAGFVPNTVTTLVEIGEETGDLDTSLYNAADWLEATKN